MTHYSILDGIMKKVAMHKISGECDASEEIDGVEYDFKIGYTVSPKEKMTRG